MVMESVVTEDVKMSNSNCPKCHGKGYYHYDENHGKLCELCCNHDKGWWLLKDNYDKLNGRYCCKAGCGVTISTQQYESMLKSL
jgi:hypothetical protein